MSDIVIEYQPNATQGIHYHYTPRQVKCQRDVGTYWMEAAKAEGYQDGDEDDLLPPEVMEPYMRSVLAVAELTQDEFRRLAYPDSIRAVRFECRAPNPLDRLAVTRLQEACDFYAAAELALELLAPRLIDGWAGEPSSDLMTCVKWECYLRVMDQEASESLSEGERKSRETIREAIRLLKVSLAQGHKDAPRLRRVLVELQSMERLPKIDTPDLEARFAGILNVLLDITKKNGSPLPS